MFNRWLNVSQKGGDLVQGGGSFPLHFFVCFLVLDIVLVVVLDVVIRCK